MVFNADSVPWCGLFVATCVSEAGPPTAPIAVHAPTWQIWGVPIAADKLAPGAVLVFQPPGGGHVGLYVGEDATAYHVLGSNQGDCIREVGVTPICPCCGYNLQREPAIVVGPFSHDPTLPAFCIDWEPALCRP